MYQAEDGQWYEDDGTPAQNPSPGSGPFTPSSQAAQFTNTAPKGAGPTGIPDPNNPGLDTAGWKLGASVNPDGTVNVPGGGANFPGITHNPAPTNPGPSPGPGGLTSPAQTPGFFPTYSVPAPYQFTPYSGFTPFSFDAYKPLTADQAAAEPGYQFARDQGRAAMDTSAAAKGNVLSGAQLKDLFAWGDQFAGQNYQNAEARNENIYGINRNNAFTNWANNEMGKYQQWAGNQQYGLPAWQANNQPGQFDATLRQQQSGLTLGDLLARFQTGVDANTRIATAGAA